MSEAGSQISARPAHAAAASVISNSLLVVLKLVAGIAMGSVSVISEAIHSGMDLVAAIIALFSVRQSARPADKTHQFGHGKVENISGTVEAILIFAAAIWIVVEAAHKVVRGTRVESLALGMAVMAVGAVVNTFVSRYLFRVAEEAGSVALKADALHLQTDVWTSLGVFAGLGLVALTGYHILDPLIALVVAAMITRAAWKLTQEAFLPLMDTALPPNEVQVITEIIDRHRPNFVEFHRVRSRRAGPERHIDLHLVVDADHTVGEAHALCDSIEKEIEECFPRTDVLIHVEPRRLTEFRGGQGAETRRSPEPQG